jgi:hypothetical protein
MRKLRKLLIAAGCLFAVWAIVLLGIVLYHILLATVRASRAEYCARCGKSDIRASWAAGIVDAVLAGLHHYPYRCRACNYRYYRFRRGRPRIVH